MVAYLHRSDPKYAWDRTRPVPVMDCPGAVHQAARYFLPQVAAAAGVAAIVSGIAVALAVTAPADARSAVGLLVAAGLTLWLRTAVVVGRAVMRARAHRVVSHPRGLEVATGVLHRRKQFIWYYQLAEEPQYVRTPLMLLTHTASLRVRYNDTAFTLATLELPGIGSPRRANQICSFLASVRLAERLPVRGALT